MFIELSAAKAHLNIVGSDDDGDIALKVSAAEQIAVEYLNRRVFVDQAALDAALIAVPAALIAAGEAYELAYDAACLIADSDARSAEKTYAFNQRAKVYREGIAVRNGIIIDDLIRAAMLLILGSLWADREDTVAGVSIAALPNGARSILDMYRVGPGV